MQEFPQRELQLLTHPTLPPTQRYCRFPQCVSDGFTTWQYLYHCYKSYPPGLTLLLMNINEHCVLTISSHFIIKKKNKKYYYKIKSDMNQNQSEGSAAKATVETRRSSPPTPSQNHLMQMQCLGTQQPAARFTRTGGDNRRIRIIPVTRFDCMCQTRNQRCWQQYLVYLANMAITYRQYHIFEEKHCRKTRIL
jgi:hypothetical protein